MTRRFTVVTECTDGFLNDVDVPAETAEEAKELAAMLSEVGAKIVQVIDSTPQIGSAARDGRLPETFDFE